MGEFLHKRSPEKNEASNGFLNQLLGEFALLFSLKEESPFKKLFTPKTNHRLAEVLGSMLFGKR